MQIIEFFGGPGSGKTTAAATCFSYFKQKMGGVEFCREYAQDLIFSGKRHYLDSQLVVVAGQYQKYMNLQLAGAKLVFADSSLLLCKIYGNQETAYRDHLHGVINHLHDELNPLKVWVKRVKPYQTFGRLQTEEQSRALDVEMYEKLGPWDFIMTGDEVGLRNLIAYLEARYGKQ